MAPGGGAFRRSVRAFVVLAIGMSLLQGFPAGAAPRSEPDLASLGERGSGIPGYPVVIPRDARARMLAMARAGGTSFSDIDENDAWAATAINYVAKTYDWMRDFSPNDDGTIPFRPDAISTRKYFARSMVRAFAPNALPDPGVQLSDVDASTAWYRFAAVAVDRGWMHAPHGRFRPDDPVTMIAAHRALVYAVGLRKAAFALNAIHTRAGVRFAPPPHFGTTMLGLRLGLRYNFPSGQESRDVGPSDPLRRAYVAYSLFRAKTLPSWAVPNLLEDYDEVELPFLGPMQESIVRWGIRSVGQPYIWGGEWGFRTPEPAALGGQPRPGFDCSGLTWWLVRADDGGSWNISPPRPYRGWSLPERTSASMAAGAPRRLDYDQLRPGDLMFYDGDRDGTVDHVDVYIGRGYALDSSNTPGGVTVMWVGDHPGRSDWYYEHFVFGRRVLPS
jgi:NlpC/P60 family